MLSFNSIKIKDVVFLLFVIVFSISFREFVNIKKEFNNNLYLIQDDFSNNKFDEVLVGNDFHEGLFDLLNNRYSFVDYNTINLYLGISLCKINHYDNAIEYLSKVVINNNLLNSKINTLIGDCYTELKDYDKALEYFNKAINYTKNGVYMYVNIVYKMVLIYEERGEYNKAVDILKDTLNKFKGEEGRELTLLKDELGKVKMLLKYK